MEILQHMFVNSSDVVFHLLRKIKFTLFKKKMLFNLYPYFSKKANNFVIYSRPFNELLLVELLEEIDRKFYRPGVLF